jgi:hypothetical protein
VGLSPEAPYRVFKEVVSVCGETAIQYVSLTALAFKRERWCIGGTVTEMSGFGCTDVSIASKLARQGSTVFPYGSPAPTSPYTRMKFTRGLFPQRRHNGKLTASPHDRNRPDGNSSWHVTLGRGSEWCRMT